MNVDDPEKFESLKKVAQRAARTMHGAAMLILGSQTPPKVILYGEDFINGIEEIESAVGTDETVEDDG
jgi:hypothetical protein